MMKEIIEEESQENESSLPSIECRGSEIQDFEMLKNHIPRVSIYDTRTSTVSNEIHDEIQSKLKKKIS